MNPTSSAHRFPPFKALSRETHGRRTRKRRKLKMETQNPSRRAAWDSSMSCYPTPARRCGAHDRHRSPPQSLRFLQIIPAQRRHPFCCGCLNLVKIAAYFVRKETFIPQGSLTKFKYARELAVRSTCTQEGSFQTPDRLPRPVSGLSGLGLSRRDIHRRPTSRSYAQGLRPRTPAGLCPDPPEELSSSGLFHLPPAGGLRPCTPQGDFVPLTPFFFPSPFPFSKIVTQNRLFCSEVTTSLPTYRFHGILT